jgi:hypothetical protein
MRPPRPDTLTITDIRSNKVRYDENEAATTKATVVNTAKGEFSGTLVADMILDVDTRREIARSAFTVAAGATKTWEFRYSVGPETYGRAIEVRFVGVDGAVVDAWQEYYAVAAEWFRVQQATHNAEMKTYTVDPWTTYFNQIHNFAAEPTDWGVQTDECAQLEQYLSGQALYHLNMNHRRGAYAHYRNLGIMGTFYQCLGFSGQMGYEVIRQHPEFSLYDDNGQFMADPIYGGYPNPFEIASSMEIGPKRHVQKPYLDRKITSWQHGLIDLAQEDAVRYMAECIKTHAKFLNCDGIYIDGNVGVWGGFRYEGNQNVPSKKAEDYAALNARNHRLFSQILKADNPNFGTWYNWSYEHLSIFFERGIPQPYLGSGTGMFGDSGDASFRAATDWKNVMLLDESAHPFSGGDSSMNFPDRHLRDLCNNRDYVVQRFGASAIRGYIANYIGIEQDLPGPDRWGWAAHNYMGAQFIATQHHFVSWFLPGWRPTSQFMTRYSRFLWAPDIKVVPDAEKLVSVEAPEELWWQRLVYRRDTADGYELIVHLVRIPPFNKWDLKWLDEPKPLDTVRISADVGAGTLRDVQAMRPYYWEEPQQPVQRPVAATVRDGRVEITVPEFRYHTMVVFRVKT